MTSLTNIADSAALLTRLTPLPPEYFPLSRPRETAQSNDSVSAMPVTLLGEMLLSRGTADTLLYVRPKGRN